MFDEFVFDAAEFSLDGLGGGVFWRWLPVSGHDAESDLGKLFDDL